MELKAETGELSKHSALDLTFLKNKEFKQK